MTVWMLYLICRLLSLLFLECNLMICNSPFLECGGVVDAYSMKDDMYDMFFIVFDSCV